MEARQSKWAKRFFKNEKDGRKLLEELIENDQLDGNTIKTSFGTFIRL